MDEFLGDWESKILRQYPAARHIFRDPRVLAMKYRQQLGSIGQYIHSARHDRYDHSGHSAYAGMLLGETLQKKGMLPKHVNVPTIIVVKMWHDIGHYPTCHAPESFFVQAMPRDEQGYPLDHKRRALQLARRKYTNGTLSFSEVAELCGAIPETCDLLLDTKNDDPFRRALFSKLGSEKMAYTKQDEAQCREAVPVPDILYLIPQIVYDEKEGRMGFDIADCVQDTGFPPVVCLLEYVRGQARQWTHRYNAPKTMALDRHVQVSVEKGVAAGLNLEALADKPDQEFVSALLNVRSDVRPELAEQARHHMLRYFHGKPYEPIIVIREQPDLERNGEAIYTEKAGFLDAFDAYFGDPREMTKLEEAVQERCGVPIIINSRGELDKRKPEEVHLYKKGDYLGTLREHRPEEYAAMDAEARRSRALRICAPEEMDSKAMITAIHDATTQIATRMIADARKKKELASPVAPAH